MGRGEELEAKFEIPCSAKDSVISVLLSMGFREEERVVEQDIYLDHPLLNLKGGDKALRFRVKAPLRGAKGVQAFLTFKGPRVSEPGSFKRRVEINAAVSPEVLQVLKELGFKESIKVVKERIYFKNNRATVTVDDVEGLGCFIEVEAGSNSYEAVVEVLERLKDLRPRPVGLTYAELVELKARSEAMRDLDEGVTG